MVVAVHSEYLEWAYFVKLVEHAMDLVVIVAVAVTVTAADVDADADAYADVGADADGDAAVVDACNALYSRVLHD